MTEREQAFSALLQRLRPEIDALLARYEQKRSALLPMTHLFQQHEGFVSAQAIGATAEILDLTQAVVESTVSFYTLLFRKPVGKYVVQICRGLACSINGAEDVMRLFREKLGVGHLETTPDGLISYEEVECLAACDRATCGQVNLEYVYDLDEKQIDAMLAAIRAGTYSTAPMPQTAATRTNLEHLRRRLGRERPKVAGRARRCGPDDPGGIGDRTGVIMLDRIVEHGLSLHGATQERLVRESREVAELIEEEEASGAGR